MNNFTSNCIDYLRIKGCAMVIMYALYTPTFSWVNLKTFVYTFILETFQLFTVDLWAISFCYGRERDLN